MQNAERSSKVHIPLDPPPVEEVPKAGDLPPGSHLPLLKLESFTGRWENLLDLGKLLLHEAKPAVYIQQKPGIDSIRGGIGKTQLAVEFCYRYGRFFHGVHWLQAGQDLNTEIAVCGEKMGIEPWPAKIPEQVEATLQEWAKGGRRLVVLDGTLEPGILQIWLPKLENVGLLIASNVDGLAEADLEVQELDALKREESLLLLRKLAPRLGLIREEELERLATRLGNLPLALDLAGRYLNERQKLSVTQYLRALDQASLASKLIPWKKKSAYNGSREWAVFKLNWDLLNRSEKKNTQARKILQAASYCAEDVPIPLTLLNKVAGDDLDSFDKGVNRLLELGLSMPSQEGLWLHSISGEFIREQAKQESLVRFAKELSELAFRMKHNKIAEGFNGLWAHVESVAEYSQERGLIAAGSLWNSLGHQRSRMGQQERAKKAFERALVISEQIYGLDHPAVAIAANNLGVALKEAGDLPGSKSAFERALAINEKAYEPNHPKVATAARNLGLVLKELGDLEKAKKRFEQALMIEEHLNGSRHSRVARDLNSLGQVLQGLGDIEGARSAYMRALSILEESAASEDPRLQAVRNDLNALSTAK